MRRALVLLCLAAAAPPAAVPPAIREMIADFFRASLVYPDATRWHFSSVGPYIDGGTLYCGEANVQNSLRQYAGFRRFYAVVRDGAINEGLMLGKAADDPSGGQKFKIDTLCGR